MMDADHIEPAAAPTAGRLSRRRMLRQSGAGLTATLAAGLTRAAAQEATPVGEAATPAGAGSPLPEEAVRQFETDIEAAMGMFRMVGAAVALVDRSGLGYDTAAATGVALHLLGAVPSTGKLGATCIAGTPAAADDLYRAVLDLVGAETL